MVSGLAQGGAKGVSRNTSVLFVIHSLGGGGAERVLVNIANALSERDFDVTVMTIVDSGLHKNNLAKGVHYKTLIPMPDKKHPNGAATNGSVSGSLLAGKSKMKKTVAAFYLWLWRHAPTSAIHAFGVRGSYDIEVAFLEGICTKFVAASRAQRKIAWVHVDVEKEPKSHKAFKSRAQETKAYAAYEKVVCVSEGVCSSMKRQFPSLGNRLTVVRNPIDTVEIKARASESIPAQYECLFEAGRVFCAIGRLCDQKAFDRLIRAAAICKDRGYHDFRVVILGEGPLEGELKKLARNLRVDDLVCFLGYQKNPYPFIAKSDAFVCVSKAEGMSTTVSEALILGVPVLSTPCSGTAELFAVGDGRIIGDSDEEIARALVHELETDREQSNGCDSAVDEFFSFETAIDNVKGVLTPYD